MRFEVLLCDLFSGDVFLIMCIYAVLILQCFTAIFFVLLCIKIPCTKFDATKLDDSENRWNMGVKDPNFREALCWPQIFSPMRFPIEDHQKNSRDPEEFVLIRKDESGKFYFL